MGGFSSIDGLISGLDTTNIIDSMIAVERRPAVLLEARQARYEALTMAYQTFSSHLLGLKSKADALARSSSFSDRSVTSSDTDVIDVTSSGGASIGTYQIGVTSLAKAHQVASQGYVDTTNATLGTGTITIAMGDNAATTIDLANGNNTLDAVRDAINASDADVSASIINTGTDAAPYRMILTANDQGADNVITVTTSLTGDNTADFTNKSISGVVAQSTNAYSGTASTSGTYTGTSNKSFVVKITADGDENSAKYVVSSDGGGTFGGELTMSGGVGVLGDGVQMDFTAGSFVTDDSFSADAFVPTVQSAADAVVTLGEGSGAISVSLDSNTSTSLIPGVTLQLKATTGATPISVTVDTNTASIRSKVNDFVAAYNSTFEFVNAASAYDEDTESAGILLGDTNVQRLQLTIARMATNPVANLPTTLNGLYSIGVTPTDVGGLTLDATELTEVMNTDIDGLMKLFSRTGESDNALINYVSTSSDTTIPSDGFDVVVTQAATRGVGVGTSITDPAVASVTIGAGNNQLNVVISGKESSVIQLTDGTYQSGAALAAEIQARINEDTNLASRDVTVVWNDQGATGYFEIYTQTYGDSSTVAMGEAPGNAAATLGLASMTSTAGTHVAGTIDGVAAMGSGQLLYGASDQTSNGFRTRVTATPDQIADAGGSISATVTVTTGIASQMSDYLEQLTDPATGLLKLKVDNFQDRIETYQQQIDRHDARLEQRRAQLVARFSQLEVALSQMQAQGSYLSSQLAGFSSSQSQT